MPSGEDGLAKVLAQKRDSITSERDFQDYLSVGMESAGWRVNREVKPNNDQYRADIIGTHDELGAVGIETKYVTNSGPKEVGEALNQIISQYAGNQFGDATVDYWAVALYGDGLFTTDSTDYAPQAREYQFASQRIANRLGVGFVIEHIEQVIIEFAPSTPTMRLPLFHTQSGLIQRGSYVDWDLNQIRQVIEDRLPV